MATITGTEAADSLLGTTGNDSISGLGGNDTLEGGAGNDTIDGGAGNDVLRGSVDGSLDGQFERNALIGGAGDDIFYAEGNDQIGEDAGGGTDIVYTRFSYIVGFGAQVETVAAVDASATTSIVVGGNEYTRTVLGNNGNNTLQGTTLSTGEAPTLIGLLGDDRYDVGTTGYIVENAGEGNDTVIVNRASSYTLNAGASVEALVAYSYNDPAKFTDPTINLTGNALSQTITGNLAANILNGGGGGDTMIGLGGNDTYLVQTAGDVVVEANGGGADIVYTTVSYNLGDNEVEALSTVDNAATDPINLVGNYLSQTIVGNYGNNLLNGGSGVDTLIGLRGNDLYVVGDAGAVVVEAAGEGADTVVTSVSYALAANTSVEVLAAQDRASTTGLVLTGNALAQTIAATEGADTLNGGGGADLLIGGGGNDVYRVFGQGEGIVETAGGGSDTVYTSGSFALSAGASVELLSTAVNAETTAITLVGSDQRQTLIGNYGNNVLDGVGDGDTLIGLYGDDVYRVYGNGDVVTEASGQGTDTIYTSANYALAAGVSVEILSTVDNSAATTIHLSGNDVANALVGNAGVNILDGGAGADTLYGLGGADTFRFSTAPVAGVIDRIADYGNGADVIQLDPNAFTGLTPGTLPPSAIAYGSAAADADDRLIYDPTTGALSFDADGTGASAAIQFASLSTGIALADLRFTVAPVESGVVALTAPSATYLVGDATGPGISLDAVYPDASGFTFGAPTGQGNLPIFVFGANSSTEPLPTLTQRDGFGAATYDFSQLREGLVVTPGTAFRTAGGVTLIDQSGYSLAANGAPPQTVIGTAFDDVIDRTNINPPGGGNQGLPTGGTLLGGGGNDYIAGGTVMDGGTGNDRLVGALSTTLTGGAGNDVFALPIATRRPGTISQSAFNTITDFSVTDDRIELVLNRTSDLPLGALDPSRFAIGTAATTPDQRIIYDPETGKLFYDSNGSLGDMSGTTNPLFAQLSAHLDLTAASMTVVAA